MKMEHIGQTVPVADVPLEASHVLHWFYELDAARGSNGFGANPISYPDIAAWRELTGAEPLPWEVRALKAMDAAYLNEFAKRKPKNG
ncbi:hypothetical protein ACLB6G_20330 [Zhengella sp. ZM62]|uniref:phage tail assembly chaperone n=1 Tax=Zhengella sedimenti TaxID=3390035 RepID=UPI003974D137